MSPGKYSFGNNWIRWQLNPTGAIFSSTIQNSPGCFPPGHLTREFHTSITENKWLYLRFTLSTLFNKRLIKLQHILLLSFRPNAPAREKCHRGNDQSQAQAMICSPSLMENLQMEREDISCEKKRVTPGAKSNRGPSIPRQFSPGSLSISFCPSVHYPELTRIVFTQSGIDDRSAQGQNTLTLSGKIPKIIRKIISKSRKIISKS